jgi:hypothetical protein
VRVATGGFIRLVNCDIIGNNWNKGTGTILLENCREFGTRGSGAGFSDVRVIGAGVAALLGGTGVDLTQHTSYAFTSGTFTVETTNRVAGVVSTITVASGVTLPAAFSAAPFVLPPSAGADDPTKERVVMLQVLRDLRILTTITPLS